MTLAAARVGERLPGLGNELPVVARRVQRNFQHAESVGVANFALRLRRAEAAMRVLSPAPNGVWSLVAVRFAACPRRLP